MKISSSFLTRTGLIAAFALAVVLARPSVADAPPQSPMFKFDFGTGPAAPGTIKVTPDTQYSPEKGYGFEPGAKLTALAHGGPDALRGDLITSHTPFLFSVALPEGNYRVTLTLGDAQGESQTTVKAESRRLMLQDVKTARGEFATRTFTVNIRNASLKSGHSVVLKEREKGVLHWDDKLTLEFNGARPSIAALEIAPAPDAVTVYLAGDSTVTDQTNEPYAGWGQMLPRFFGRQVAVANHAESGETLRSSLAARRLEKILDTLKRGDYLFIQFGHNDQKEKGEGVGAFTTYSDSLRQWVKAARECGATPVLLTSMQRRRFGADGKVEQTLGDFPEAVRRVARELSVPLIDLNAASTTFYEALGPDASKSAFVHYPANTFPGQTATLRDDTHPNAYGAFQLARVVVDGIKRDLPDLAKHLTEDAATYDPAHPDVIDTWNWPASPVFSVQKPDGD
ncbi:MAG: rhamnogalacturonan acetylesterase [Armatimonadetes bacterium]|nr:rhamnogalacturonan acetylesterase [Armatimonadota bacterium]